MLAAVGVTADEEGVYRALIRAPGSTVEELGAAVGRDSVDVGPTVRRLEELGFLSRSVDLPQRLVPVRPDVAVAVLAARRRAELDRAQAAAREMVPEFELPGRFRPDSLVEVVVGREATANRFAQLLQATRSELLVLDRPPYIAPAEKSDQQVRGLLHEGVRVRGIYSPDSLELPGAVGEASSASEAGEQGRIHPHVPMKLAISDRSTAILPLSLDEAGDDEPDLGIGGGSLVVRGGALLDALVAMFELMWDQALPGPVPPGEQDAGPDGPLLTLLAAGLKDDAIARQLSLSTRTVGRRIAGLMDALGARTRFQAGLLAQRRSLFDDGGR